MVLSPPDVTCWAADRVHCDGTPAHEDLLVGHGCEVPARIAVPRCGHPEAGADRGAMRRRSVLLGTRAWVETTPPASAMRCRVKWTATFTCDDMVATVDAAPVSRTIGLLRGANAERSAPRSRGSVRGISARADPHPPLLGDRLQIFDQVHTRGRRALLARRDIVTIRDPERGTSRAPIGSPSTSRGFADVPAPRSRRTDPWFLSTWQVAPFVSIGEGGPGPGGSGGSVAERLEQRPLLLLGFCSS